MLLLLLPLPPLLLLPPLLPVPVGSALAPLASPPVPLLAGSLNFLANFVIRSLTDVRTDPPREVVSGRLDATLPAPPLQRSPATEPLPDRRRVRAHLRRHGAGRGGRVPSP